MLVRQANHARMMEYLRGRGCSVCGVDNPVVLEFHHIRDRGHKRASVSVLVSHGYNWSTVQAEIAKCEVLCANCHRIRTASDRGHYRSVRGGHAEGARKRPARRNASPVPLL
jgi:hypothetical protein